jgi:hypothetical protein
MSDYLDQRLERSAARRAANQAAKAGVSMASIDDVENAKAKHNIMLAHTVRSTTPAPAEPKAGPTPRRTALAQARAKINAAVPKRHSMPDPKLAHIGSASWHKEQSKMLAERAKAPIVHGPFSDSSSIKIQKDLKRQDKESSDNHWAAHKQLAPGEKVVSDSAARGKAGVNAKMAARAAIAHATASPSHGPIGQAHAAAQTGQLAAHDAHATLMKVAQTHPEQSVRDHALKAANSVVKHATPSGMSPADHERIFGKGPGAPKFDHPAINYAGKKKNQPKVDPGPAGVAAARGGEAPYKGPSAHDEMRAAGAKHAAEWEAKHGAKPGTPDTRSSMEHPKMIEKGPGAKTPQQKNVARAAKGQAPKLPERAAGSQIGPGSDVKHLGNHAKYGAVLKGPKGGQYVVHNGVKYYGKYI